MRAPYRIIRGVPVENDRGELRPWPGYPADTSIDVVPLPDVEILRRKAIAWDYAVRRGFMASSRVTAAMDFARLDVETSKVEPDDVVLFRTPDLGKDGLEDLGESLSAAFPENRVVILPGDTGGFEARSEEDARAIPGVAPALDELAERTPARKPRET